MNKKRLLIIYYGLIESLVKNKIKLYKINYWFKIKVFLLYFIVIIVTIRLWTILLNDIFIVFQLNYNEHSYLIGGVESNSSTQSIEREENKNDGWDSYFVFFLLGNFIGLFLLMGPAFICLFLVDPVIIFIVEPTLFFFNIMMCTIGVDSTYEIFFNSMQYGHYTVDDEIESLYIMLDEFNVGVSERIDEIIDERRAKAGERMDDILNEFGTQNNNNNN